MSKRGLRALTVLVSGLAALAVWGGVRAVEARRLRAGLEQAKREMAEGRYNVAWSRLSGLFGGRRRRRGRVSARAYANCIAAIAPPRCWPGTRARGDAIRVSRGRADCHADHGLGPIHPGRGAVARLRSCHLPDSEKSEPLRALQLLYQLEGRNRGHPPGDRRVLGVGRLAGGRAGAALPPRHGPVAARDDAECPREGGLRPTIESGSPGRTWRSRPAGSTWRGVGSTPACVASPTTGLSWHSRLDLAVASGDVDAPGGGSSICRPTGCRRPSRSGSGPGSPDNWATPGPSGRPWSLWFTRSPATPPDSPAWPSSPWRPARPTKSSGSCAGTAEMTAAKDAIASCSAARLLGDPAELARLAEARAAARRPAGGP